MKTSPLAVESAVKQRYAAGAQAQDAALCCPVSYDPRYLEVIPQEVIERDYGCGDPSRYLRRGETVLDLGSGTGKICFIAAQVVGPEGTVIGVDMTDAMLEVARRNAPVVAERAVAAVLIGESGPTLEAQFREAGLAHTERAATLEDAVRRADALARSSLGDRPGPATVLLSPAAASFDMFEDYAARGRAFKQAVAELAASRAGGGDQ